MLSERSNLQKEFIDMYLPCAREGEVGKMTANHCFFEG